MSIKLTTREEVLGAIRNHGPLRHVSLPAYLSLRYTSREIDTALFELVYLGRVSVSKERQLSAV
jgi:hypothetical protein